MEKIMIKSLQELANGFQERKEILEELGRKPSIIEMFLIGKDFNDVLACL
jgi:hypothetical protein